MFDVFFNYFKLLRGKAILFTTCSCTWPILSPSSAICCKLAWVCFTTYPPSVAKRAKTHILSYFSENIIYSCLYSPLMLLSTTTFVGTAFTLHIKLHHHPYLWIVPYYLHKCVYISFGQEGIRTPEVTPYGFQNRRNRPLCHPPTIFSNMMCILFHPLQS